MIESSFDYFTFQLQQDFLKLDTFTRLMTHSVIMPENSCTLHHIDEGIVGVKDYLLCNGIVGASSSPLLLALSSTLSSASLNKIVKS